MKFREFWGVSFGRRGNFKKAVPLNERVQFRTPDANLAQVGWFVSGLASTFFDGTIMLRVFKDGELVAEKEDQLNFHIAPEPVTDGLRGKDWVVGGQPVQGSGASLIGPFHLLPNTDYEFEIDRLEGDDEDDADNTRMITYRCTGREMTGPDPVEPPVTPEPVPARGVWVDGVEYVPKG
jgi:hypothetical protein